jgi:hypothetical protein
VYQELITYLIIALAAGVAILKLKRRFLIRKVEKKCTDTETLKTDGCGGCGASCPVRQTPFAGKK